VFKVDRFVDEHGEWLIGEEEVLFFRAKDASQVWIGSGMEVTGDGGSGVDGVDFVAVASYKGVLPCESLEGEGNGGLEDAARLRDHGDLRCDLLGKAAFGGPFGAMHQLWPRAAATCLHHRGPRRQT
jgi:hypothetical protein